MPELEVVRDRAVRLFSYLRELSLLRSPVIRTVDQYESVLWFDELPDHPSIRSIERAPIPDDPDLWLEIQRSDEPRLKEPRSLLSEWIDATRLHESAVEPTLRAAVVRFSAEGMQQSISLSDHPEVLQAWEAYLADVWRPWAERHREWLTLYERYEHVFSIYQQIQKLGEAFEFVLGLGLLIWKTPAGDVRRHILCGGAEIDFETVRGIVSVRGASDGVKLHLETEMLEVSERPTNEPDLQRQSEEIAETPWDKPKVLSILEGWVHSASPRGAFHQLDTAAAPTNDPQILLRPALILRKRSGRSIVASFEKIIGDLKAGGPIPTEVQRLCVVSQTGIIGDATGRSDGRLDLPGTVCFPLPANDEQLQIAERVRTAKGVLVQGPPGTGKSHTIANLICDLLANGNRVLVTSQTPRALKVLKEKIPVEIAPIAVVVLGNDAKELGDLEASIAGITGRYASHNDFDVKRRIDDLENELSKARERQARSASRLRDIRESDTAYHRPCEGYEGTAMEIAKKVANERSRFAWFTDLPGPNDVLRVDLSRLRVALEALRTYPEDISDELLKPTIDQVKLWTATAFAENVQATTQVKDELRLRESRGTADNSLVRLSREIRDLLDQRLRKVCELHAELSGHSIDWLGGAISDVLGNKDGRWEQLRNDSAEALQGLADRVSAVQKYDVTLPGAFDLVAVLADASDLLAHLRANGAIGFWILRPKVVKRAEYLLKNARINGREVATIESLEPFVEFVRARIELRRAWAVWDEVADRTTGPMLRQVRVLEDQHQAVESLLEFRTAVHETRQALNSVLVPHPVWQDPANITLLIERLASVSLIEELSASQGALRSFVSTLEHEAADSRRHGIVAELREAAATANPVRYAAALAHFSDVNEKAELVRARNSFLASARQQLPNLVAAVVETPSNAEWDGAFSELGEAWNWGRAVAWLDEYEHVHQLAPVEQEYESASEMVATTLGTLAAEKAWQHCFLRMTEEQRQHLVAWGKTVKKIGKASKYAVQRRKEAQSHMEKCRGAVPAWIMPFHRVVETVSPAPDQFDVVIIDEASQSGPETLLLTYIAKQVVIVGDDRQIAPEYVGFNQETVNQLIDRYLRDFDLRNTFGLGFSLFEHGDIRYGNRVVLREHFRCMPEIIRFSNDLCYRDTPLVPLRQYSANRLEPIMVRHVESGYREGDSSHALNRPEAVAVADEIVHCCSDPRYEGKTIGVISLQGEAQAQLIERELVKKLSPQEIVNRRIVCGDAYAFQGDERDIMFLSLVAAPNERIGPLTKETDIRRFNVAASRAKDQMWLFHTARSQDLNPADMRARLLRYMSNPEIASYDEPDFTKCESQFEVDVARALYKRDYRFYLQYEPFGPGGRRIDIVVEGAKARLAVECDGDQWHGPDRWDADMARQRQLQRCGWEFWRVRGSEFYKAPEAALEELWEMLTWMGIYPGATDPPPGPAPERPRRQKREASSRIVHVVPPPVVDAAVPSGRGSVDFDTPSSAAMEAPNTVVRLPVSRFTDLDECGGDSLGGDEADTIDADEEDGMSPTVAPALLRTIDDIPQPEIHAVFEEILAERPRVSRDDFLHNAAAKLGFQKLGSRIRKRLNRAIGGEIRAGRLKNNWDFIEKK